MNRFARVVSSLVLIALLGVSAVGMGLCICADGHVALEMGCHGGCPNAEAAADCRQGAEAEKLITACGDRGGDCIYVPLSAGAILYSSSSDAKLSLSAKRLSLGAHQAGDVNSRDSGAVRANASRALYVSMCASASVLAQRTIVLRI